jgi:hypothetical protein
VTFEPVKGGKAETLKADVVLVATGRAPYTRGLGLEEAGVKLDDKGRIAVGDRFETSVDGIYAIGDVIRGPMLAHKAQEEGLAMAEILAGQSGHVNYGVIASVVYTFPEIAGLGMTEEDLKAAGIEYRAGKFPFLANGRAKSNQTTDGFVKVLADAATDRVLGVHMMGPHAGRADPRGCGADGVRRLGGGPGPHLPCPPHLLRSCQRGRAGRRQPGDPRLGPEHEHVVDGHAGDAVDALGLDRVGLPDEAGQVLGMAGGGKGAGDGDQHDLLAGEHLRRGHFLRALVGHRHERGLGQPVADGNGHGIILVVCRR